MNKNDLTIDFARKIIKLRRKKQSLPGLYSYLQDVFDESENMKYAIPIEVVSRDKYRLINGWKIDRAGRRLLTGAALVSRQDRKELAVKINLNYLVSGSTYEVYNITAALTMAIGTAVASSVEVAGLGADGDFIRIRVRPAGSKFKTPFLEIQTVVVNQAVKVNLNNV